MTPNRFYGDPKLFLGQNGSSLVFKGGQPVMDGGLENQASISLFTSTGWWGNDLISDADKQIGSDFEETARGTITLQKLRDIEKSSVSALQYQAYGDIEATAINQVSSRIDLLIRITSPGKDVEELRVTRNGQNWQNQAVDPAYEKE